MTYQPADQAQCEIQAPESNHRARFAAEAEKDADGTSMGAMVSIRKTRLPAAMIFNMEITIATATMVRTGLVTLVRTNQAKMAAIRKANRTARRQRFRTEKAITADCAQLIAD